jgi:two-component system sensor kinase FixL
VEIGFLPRRVALLGAGLAVIVVLTVLAGWSTGSPGVASFGSRNLPMQPMSAIACLSLALAIWTAVEGRRTLSALLLIPALMVAVSTLFQEAAGTSFGIDTILFHSQVVQQPDPFPGRPRLAPVVAMLLIGTAILLAARRGSQLGSIAVLLASVALAISILSFLGHLLGLRPDGESALLGASRPGALTGLLLSAAVVAWRSESGWPALLRSRGVEGNILRIAFPLVLLMPVLSALIEIWVRESARNFVDSSVMLAAGINVLAMAALLFWATGRMMREREERLELVRALDAAPIALARLDGTILHWSDGCAKLYGFTAAEAVGRVKAELLQTCTRGGSATPADRLEDDPRSEMEIIETAKDGSPLHIIEQAQLLPSRSKREPLVVLSMTDISARTRAEEALRESQVRLSLALEAHRIGAFEWDAHTGKFHWSPGSEERLGLKPGTITDFDSWQEHVEPGDFEAIRYSMDQAIANRAERFSFHYRFRKPSGTVRTIEGSSRCFYDSWGKLVRTVGINVDVTERDEREAELEARQAQVRSILETVPDAMVVIDERGIIRSFSSAAERLFGYQASEIVHQGIATIMPAAAPGIRRFIKRYLQHDGRRPESGPLLSAVHRDGSEIPVELSVGEALIGGERLLTIFMRDVSERVATELRMAELNSELLHAARLSAMGEMAEGLAHELNQPLTASINFLGAAEMLLAREDADLFQVRDLIDMARDQALRTGDIIRRLRAFVAKGEVEVRAEPVDEVIRDAVALVVASSFQPDVTVEYDLQSEQRMMLVDRVQVQQVLVNLLRNAVEALRQTETGAGEILIATRCVDEEMIEISVADTGPGLPESFLKAPYKSFSSTKEEGMGVGLSICRRIVEAHGGKLTAGNRPEGGAIFRFTLQTIEEKELLDA